MKSPLFCQKWLKEQDDPQKEQDGAGRSRTGAGVTHFVLLHSRPHGYWAGWKLDP